MKIGTKKYLSIWLLRHASVLDKFLSIHLRKPAVSNQFRFYKSN